MSSLADRARAALVEVADSEAAPVMQAYMKTDMPFYGVKRRARRSIERALARDYPASSPAEYRANLLALWELPHREEKYLALSYGRAFPDFIEPAQLDLFERLVREGAWWDLVDETATKLVGPVVQAHRGTTRSTLEAWIDDADRWIRRTALICQLGHKAETDATMLFDFSRRRMHESEFFIRKAIGWALREYAKTDPDAVRAFVAEHDDALSGLSKREALKNL